MKANLKGLNFQELLVAHGEKIGLGVVALFSVLAVTGMTRWATYQEKTPQELIDKVAVEKANLQQSQWPEEKQQQYALRHDISQSAQKMLAKVDVTEFKYPLGQKLIQSLYKYQEPIREPEWLSVEGLVATGVRVPIQIASTMDDGTETDEESGTPDGKATPSEPEDPRLVRRGPGRGGLGPLSGPGAAGAYGPAGGHDSAGAGPMGIALAGPMGHGAAGMTAIDEYYGTADGEMMAGLGSNIEVEGVRFVAVRGVFRLREQIQKIIAALGDPEAAAGREQELVNIISFELQRQTAQAGPDPWTGNWETITVEKAKDVLSRAADWDQEVVLASITDPVITCPLPLRVMGLWGDEASHPSVKQFALTEEGRALQQRIQEALSKWQEEQKQLQQTEQLQKGGFSDVARDARRTTMQFGSGMYGGMAGMAGGMNSRMGSAGYQQQFSTVFGRGPMGGQIDQNEQSLIQEQIKNAVNASGHLLLFRFFDYTVVPGNVYRYRVRLELENPNRHAAPDAAVDPSVVTGKTRNTQWSNATPPVYVEDDAQYFVSRVKSAAAPKPDQAGIDIFQWLPNIGTMTRGYLEVNLGQFVGGKTRTTVVVPEKEVKQDEVEFQTDDMLVDISDGTRIIDPSEHAALGLKNRQLDLLDQAIVVDPSGELVALNPYRDATERASAQKWVDQVRELYKDLEATKQPLDMEGMPGGHGAADYGEQMQMLMMEGMMGENPYGPPAGQRRNQRAGRNPLRKTGGR